jgi:hypothetical protein
MTGGPFIEIENPDRHSDGREDLYPNLYRACATRSVARGLMKQRTLSRNLGFHPGGSVP